jgi:Bacterial membrane protein YfhO
LSRSGGDSPAAAGSASGGARSAWLALALVALASLASNPRAAVPRLSYYFRDFTIAFYPQRLLVARELGTAGWPWWNRYVEEGTFTLPAFYPGDLLLTLWSSPQAASWLLTLHLPLAALAAFLLARELGGGAWGGFVSGCVFSLGGLCASSLSLWIFLEALAWAPLLVFSLRRAATLGGRWTAVAAVVLGLSITTLAVEFTAQSVLLGVGLGLAGNPRPRAWARLAVAALLGCGLAAVPIAVMLGILGETARGAGFAPDVALGNEVHPMVLLQVLVPGLFGSLADPVDKWWGGAFFTKGFPYFLSLYLGSLSLALAGVGAGRLPRRERRVLLALMALGLWYCLGTRGGLASWVASAPLLRSFRFPGKAFLLPYLGVALLAGLGVERLRARRGWLGFAGLCGALGALCVGILAWLVARQGAGFVPWTYPGVRRDVTWELVTAGGVALLACGIAALVRLGVLPPRRAAAAVALLLLADLARAGAGMNPQVAPAFFEPLPELAALRLGSLQGGRVFSYGLDYSPAFSHFLGSATPGKGLWSFFLSRQILAPYANILDGVEAAESKDLTSFVPRFARLRPEQYDPAAVGGLLDRLRFAAVTRVLSLDPLEDPALVPLAVVPAGPPGLAIHAYELTGSLPRVYLACPTDGAGAGAICPSGRVRPTLASACDETYVVDGDVAARLVVRDNYARGWQARVDGRPTPVTRANGRHRAVAVPAGRHEVRMHYEPPGLRGGMLAFAASVLLVSGLLWRGAKTP